MKPLQLNTEEKARETKYRAFNIGEIRRDFPILDRIINFKRLAYLDNAATTQKPHCVIEATNNFYSNYNANIHRGIYLLSEESTQAYESAREKVYKFINASAPREIIFTRGATEAINLVAYSYGRYNIREGDEIIISNMEHHSNIVPWQILCEEKRAKLRVIPITDSGELIMEEFERLLNERTKFVSVNHMSNTLGTINPIKDIIEIAHRWGIPVLIDGAQAVSHLNIDVQELDCDFYVFSGHKVFGPTGIGVLYGKRDLLETMPPYQAGGNMIKSVTFEKTIYSDIPYKFEAGTPNIVGAIGLSSAIDYLQNFSFNDIIRYERDLVEYATQGLTEIEGIRIIGTAKEKAAVISFILKDIHPHDIGTFLDSEGIAIRAGHHCTQPLMKRFNIPATARASFSIYNTKEEADRLVSAIYKVKKFFAQ